MSEELISKKIVAFEEMKANRNLLYYAMGGIVCIMVAVFSWVDAPTVTYAAVTVYTVYSALMLVKAKKRNDYLAKKYGLENKPLFSGLDLTGNDGGNTTDKPK